MKKLLIILMFASSFCNAQYSFEKVIEVDSVSKEALFNRAKFWVMKYYKNPDRVLISESIEDGFMKMKTGFKYDSKHGYHYSADYNYDIELYFKEGRYKFVLTNVISPTYGIYKEDQQYIKEPKNKKQEKGYESIMDEIRLRLKLETVMIWTSLETSLNTPLETEKDW